MPFCPACRSEYRTGFTRCEECDAGLVADRPPEPERPVFIPRVTVFQTTNYPDALVVSAVLEGNGISTHIDNLHVSQWLLGMPTPAFPLRLRVPRGDAPAAVEAIRDKVAEETEAAVRPKHHNRRWLIAMALCVPALGGGEFRFGSLQSFAAAGAWAALTLGLILDLRDRRSPPALSEAKIGLFFLLGCLSFAVITIPPIPWDLEWIDTGIVSAHTFLAALIEEGVKLLAVLFAMTLADRRDRFAWMVAGAAAGAGFGLIEGLLKVQLYRYPDTAIISGAASLLHPLLTGFVGYMIARSGWVGGISGLFLAAMMHGVWNAFAIREELAWIDFLALGLVLWFYFKTVDQWIDTVPGKPQLDRPNSSSAPAT